MRLYTGADVDHQKYICLAGREHPCIYRFLIFGGKLVQTNWKYKSAKSHVLLTLLKGWKKGITVELAQDGSEEKSASAIQLRTRSNKLCFAQIIFHNLLCMLQQKVIISYRSNMLEMYLSSTA